eukprot:GHRR01023110.1.p1 GENE.GHRR01023110.1~~GHRR01023110.1.p1  ORF type:complete len:513 (+),score=201.87 GHRR01023110.1:225-1763(+)
MKDRDLDFLIVQYLKKKGYAHAEQVFRVQANFDRSAHEVQSLDHHLDADSGLQDLLFSYAAENDPQHLVDSFEQLVAWSDSSLDLYKAELQRVLYPVFVHVYLQLVQYGASNTAADLLKRYRRRFVEVGGRQSSIRAQELQELQSVAVAQHLDVNPFARAARTSRSSVVMSSYAFELLMHFLQSSKQWLILGVINQHVRFELHEGLPLLDGSAAGGAGDEAGTGLLQGRAGADAGAINATILDLGLLRDGIEDAYAQQKMQEEEEKLTKQAAATTAIAASADPFTDFMEVDGSNAAGGGAVSSAAQQAAATAKRLRAVKERALAVARAKQRDMIDSRRPPAIPLLPPHDKLRKATQDDLDARVNVSPLDLPSCCFFTILNSSSGSGRNGQAAAAAAAAGLTAMTTSRDAKLLAAGFADSSIKLYNMALLGKQRGRLKDKLERRAGREEREAAAAAAKRQKGGGGQQQQQDVMDVDMEEEELQVCALVFVMCCLNPLHEGLWFCRACNILASQ